MFQVAAKVSGGVVDYAAGWPRIENIEGAFQFRGSRMDFHARQATISGVRLANEARPVEGPLERGGVQDGCVVPARRFERMRQHT